MRTVRFTEKDGALLFKATDVSEVFEAPVEDFEPEYVTAERFGQMVHEGGLVHGESLTVRFERVTPS